MTRIRDDACVAQGVHMRSSALLLVLAVLTDTDPSLSSVPDWAGAQPTASDCRDDTTTVATEKAAVAECGLSSDGEMSCCVGHPSHKHFGEHGRPGKHLWTCSMRHEFDAWIALLSVLSLSSRRGRRLPCDCHADAGARCPADMV